MAAAAILSGCRKPPDAGEGSSHEKTNKTRFSRRMERKKVRELIAYYDNQTEEERAAEIEAAREAPGQVWMRVPAELVPAIGRLVEQHQRRAANGRVSRRSKAPRH